MNISTVVLRDDQEVKKLTQTIQNPTKSLIIAFGESQFEHASEVIRLVNRQYPDTTMIGCSTSGVIDGQEIFDDAIAVTIVEFAHTTVQYASVQIEDSLESYEAGETLGRKLMAPNLRGIFVLSDGLMVNGSELVQGFNAVLPEHVVVSGGLAGDGRRFQQTWVIHDGQAKSGYVTAVGLYGDAVRIGHGSKGGWDRLGIERKVTRSERNVLYELDGKPALELYKTYLGDRAAELPASCLFFPIAIRADETSDRTLVRTILAIDEERQSMTFAGDIPENSMVQLMRANFDRLIEGASQAATLTRSEGDSLTPTLAIAISCVGRRLVLGERSEEEIEGTMDVLPQGTTQTGFYSYGEISPYTNGRCELHNQTMTLTTISEE